MAGCASSNAPSPVADYDLIYSAGPDGNADVYIAHMDGTEAVQVTTSIANEFWPSLSPDGYKILFTSWRTNQGEIYLMNPDGTAQLGAAPPTPSNLPRWRTCYLHGPRNELIRIAFS